MTTFSKKVKRELSKLNNLNDKELDWYELFGYSLTNASNVFITGSKYNINRYARLLSNIGVDDYKIGISGNNFEIKTKKKMEKILLETLNKEKFSKADSIYEKFLNEINSEKYKEKKEKIKKEKENAVIRGAFLGGGTISEPQKAYHLEIHFKDEESLNLCANILSNHQIKANFIRSKHILYIEEGDSISNFLAFIGAKNSVLEFEDTRVVKEIRNNVNRQLNLETANLNKTIESSVKQINYIKLIKKKNRFGELSEKEKKLACLRLNNPDASLEELRKMLGENISKSGVSHRMKKIEELAKNLETNDY